MFKGYFQMRKLTFALLAGALAFFVPMAAAQAQTYTNINAGVTAGGNSSVTLGPFDPNTLVSAILNSDPINLGTAMSNAQGFATFNFKVPANFSGSHHVTATGKLNGQTVTLSSPTFQVKAPVASTNNGVSGNNGNLGYARTGANSNTVPMAIGGASAVALGAGLVVVAKRRRTATAAVAV